MFKAAIITIGQSPRPDITGDIAACLGGGARVAEYGALDGCADYDEAMALYGFGGVGERLTTKAFGREIGICAGHLPGLLQQCISRAEDEGADVVALACTGQFPAFCHRVPLLKPQRFLYPVVKSLVAGGTLGVIAPNAQQIAQMEAWWQAFGLNVVVAAASPYSGRMEEIATAAAGLKARGADLLCLDCMGFDLAMKDHARRAAGLPAVLPRQLLAMLIDEIRQAYE